MGDTSPYHIIVIPTIETHRDPSFCYMGISENRGPKYSTLNSRILIIRTPNKVPLIFGHPQKGLRTPLGLHIT